MAYIFTIIFVSNLVSNLCKIFLCIAQHQKPTVLKFDCFLLIRQVSRVIVSVYLFLVKFFFELYKVSLACMMIFNEFFRTRYKNEQIWSFQSSFFFSTSFGGRPKTKKAEYSKKAKATDITEYMIQSNSTRLYRLRFNQSNMESSSNKSSEKTQDKTHLSKVQEYTQGNIHSQFCS